MPTSTIAYFCVIAGLSMLVGWWTTFRNRPYLGLLGGFFLVLAAVVAIGVRLQDGERGRLLLWGWWAAVAVGAVLLGAAFVTAGQESRRRIQEVREHYRAAEEAMVEMARLQQEKLRQPPTGTEGKETPQEDKPDSGASSE